MFHRMRRLWPCLVFLAPLGLLLVAGCRDSRSSGDSAPGTYLFCFWNVENLFDDREDGRQQVDKEYDVWFARDTEALQLKLKRLSEALLRLNNGKGPDILAMAEVENVRAAELLRDELNRRLSDDSLHYKNLLMKE
ncbi:MAG TPA: hypothetical protein VKI65_12970, partial [Gemmataceae bacterium]|nr:hypothetical protein [Gemmataceae bacterium]